MAEIYNRHLHYQLIKKTHFYTAKHLDFDGSAIKQEIEFEFFDLPESNSSVIIKDSLSFLMFAYLAEREEYQFETGQFLVLPSGKCFRTNKYNSQLFNVDAGLVRFLYRKRFHKFKATFYYTSREAVVDPTTPSSSQIIDDEEMPSV